MAPLQPAADVGKAVNRGERDQQPRDERDVEHEESPKQSKATIVSSHIKAIGRSRAAGVKDA
jgi:hypothetical protein